MTVPAEVHNPDGRRVELTAERWGHILDEHPEMSEHHDAVLAGFRYQRRENIAYVLGAVPHLHGCFEGLRVRPDELGEARDRA